MLIVTADDYGKTRHATDSILECFFNQRITSVSAMVFMDDSERAASLASGIGVEVGLHLNFTSPYSASNVPLKLREHQNRVAAYLGRYKLCQVIYNPFLVDSFRYIFMSEYEEFVRLYERYPNFYNGHHHMHLCANILASRMIPDGTSVRRSFSFDLGEKNLLNLFYRHILNLWISSRYLSSDCFFSIYPVQNRERLQNIINRAVKEIVEIEVHPENCEEIEFLLSDQYQNMVSGVYRGGFQYLHTN